MGANSHIQWTTHTFNPWIGCTRVSPGCQHCYAETLNNRMGWAGWGPKGARSRTSEANWRKPLAWDRVAEKSGERTFVFCASLADVFDPHPSIGQQWRDDLYGLILATPHLTWQILTKRPELIGEMAPENWLDGFPRNVWIGTSVEDQRRADERIPELLKIPATVRFLSCEPLLGPVLLGDWWGRDERMALSLINWVIVGGESGPGARPMNLNWAHDVVDQCQQAGVPAFVKQLGGYPNKRGEPNGWPADLRVREMPS
jgi:protein gp37